MHGDKGGAGPEPPAKRPQGPETLLARQEMQGPQAGRAVERAFGRIVDIALVESHAATGRSEGLARLGDHLRRGVDTVEAPSRLRLREGSQF